MKVLRCRFNCDFDLTALAGFDAKALPYLLGWFGRLMNSSKSADLKDEQSRRSAFYRVIRHSPELVGLARFNGKAENQVALLAHKAEVFESERKVKASGSSKRPKIEQKFGKAKFHKIGLYYCTPL